MEDKGYELVDDSSKNITVKDDGNKVTFLCKKTIQCTINYQVKSVDGKSPGTPTNTQEVVKQGEKVQGSKLTITPGYKFSHWENSKGEKVAETEFIEPVLTEEDYKKGSVTYTACFEKASDLSYTVKYVEKGTNTERLQQ